MPLIVIFLLGFSIAASYVCYRIGIQKLEKNWVSKWNYNQQKNTGLKVNTQSVNINDKHFNPNCFTPPLSKIAAISTVLAQENADNINYNILQAHLQQSKVEFAVASKHYHHQIILIEQILDLQLNSQ